MATMEGVNNGSSAAAIGTGFLRKIIGWAHWNSTEWQFMFIDYSIHIVRVYLCMYSCQLCCDACPSHHSKQKRV